MDMIKCSTVAKHPVGQRVVHQDLPQSHKDDCCAEGDCCDHLEIVRMLSGTHSAQRMHQS